MNDHDKSYCNKKLSHPSAHLPLAEVSRFIKSSNGINRSEFISVSFNNKVNKGNPLYYLADTNKLETHGFEAKKNFKHELNNYVEWVKNLDD